MRPRRIGRKQFKRTRPRERRWSRSDRRKSKQEKSSKGVATQLFRHGHSQHAFFVHDRRAARRNLFPSAAPTVGAAIVRPPRSRESPPLLRRKFPHLQNPMANRRTFGGPPHGFGPVVHIDDVKPAQLFFRIRVRSVQHFGFAIFATQGPSTTAESQPSIHLQHSGVGQRPCVRRIGRHPLLLLLGSQLLPPVLSYVCHQDEFHFQPPISSRP